MEWKLGLGKGYVCVCHEVNEVFIHPSGYCLAKGKPILILFNDREMTTLLNPRPVNPGPQNPRPLNLKA